MRIPAWWFVAGCVAMNIVYALIYWAQDETGQIAWFAHLGGFAAGVLIAAAWRIGESTFQRPAAEAVR